MKTDLKVVSHVVVAVVVISLNNVHSHHIE
jgi:hypothetical protein